MTMMRGFGLGAHPRHCQLRHGIVKDTHEPPTTGGTGAGEQAGVLCAAQLNSRKALNEERAHTRATEQNKDERRGFGNTSGGAPGYTQKISLDCDERHHLPQTQVGFVFMSSCKCQTIHKYNSITGHLHVLYSNS
ncbi:hypothetical protein AMELA_G00277400 [Ameiurus melas]|uniref:Uncharacterized protein n=1 Tax=Ameiurus melas TaxID=219545 RepID=A0A7J5ZJU6_AMEME|nr:hypothetical protein AMELA_G00277400 [Ameiurus melas]